jgi:hypothetical protein
MRRNALTLPDQPKRLSEDLSIFSCIYLGVCSDGAEASGGAFGYGAPASIAMPRRVTYSLRDNGAAAALSCAMPWPGQCCSRVSCRNGGYKTHHGACW